MWMFNTDSGCGCLVLILFPLIRLVIFGINIFLLKLILVRNILVTTKKAA